MPPEARSPARAVHLQGVTLAKAGRFDEAIALFRRALEIEPVYPEAETNLGSALLSRGELVEASALLARTVAEPGAPLQASASLAKACSLLGELTRASEILERASMRPDATPSLLSQRCYASLLDPEASAESVLAAHRRFDRVVVAPRLAVASPRPERPRPPRPVIGYVSADLRRHSVACFLEAVLEAHDRDRFTLVAYSDARSEDEVTARLRRHFDVFRQVAGLGEEALASQIEADGVTTLIDLGGHMAPNRQPVFARRPAPVQLTYLGYPGTTGSSAFDGRITDRVADPDDRPQAAGPEPLVYVEGGCWAFRPDADSPGVSAAPSEQTRHITFGSMNDLLKVNDRVLSTWAEVVRAVPGSRLLLKARDLGSADARARVLGVLASRGVDEARVTLLSATATRREHLEAYARIDVALDTFPYGGATTTCEALFMGVPVVTLAGDRHAGRMSASMLSAVGADELRAGERASYVSVASALALSPGRLASYRADLRPRLLASPLGDGARLARAIERLAAEDPRGRAG